MKKDLNQSTAERILHIFPSSFPGGSELCALETMKALQAEGYDNFAVLPVSGPLEKKITDYSKGLVIIPNDWWMSDPSWSWMLKFKMIRGFFRSANRIKEYIKRNSIDIVITHTIVVPSGAIAAYRAGVPHFWYIHEYGDIDHRLHFNYGKKNMLFFVRHFSKEVLVNSKALYSHFSRYIQKEKLHQLYYAVNYPLSPPIHFKTPETLAITVVGRIATGKNQLVALKALDILKKENIHPRITFVGGADEEYLHMLKQYALDAGIMKQVLFTGQTDEPWKYVQQADCVLVCSINEAFGRVTVEAMKSGKIAVVSSTGAGPELIKNGVTGFLFEPEDAVTLADILKKIWLSDTTYNITEPAYHFAKESFNEEVHKKSIVHILNKE